MRLRIIEAIIFEGPISTLLVECIQIRGFTNGIRKSVESKCHVELIPHETKCLVTWDVEAVAH